MLKKVPGKRKTVRPPKKASNNRFFLRPFFEVFAPFLDGAFFLHFRPYPRPIALFLIFPIAKRGRNWHNLNTNNILTVSQKSPGPFTSGHCLIWLPARSFIFATFHESIIFFRFLTGKSTNAPRGAFLLVACVVRSRDILPVIELPKDMSWCFSKFHDLLFLFPSS